MSAKQRFKFKIGNVFSPPLKYGGFLVMIIGIVIAGLVSKPWLVIGVILIVYLASLPICFVFFQKRLEQKGWAKE